MPVRPSVRYRMRLLLELWSICGDRLADAVRWTEAERLSGLYGKAFRKSKRRSVVTGNTAPTEVSSGGLAGAGGTAGPVAAGGTAGAGGLAGAGGPAGAGGLAGAGGP